MKTADEQGNHPRPRDVSLPSPTQAPATTPVIHNPRQIPGDRDAGRHNDMGLLTMTPRWALCPLDGQAHAVDAWADHPSGIWIARCGYRLPGSTGLHDDPPGQQCSTCARWSQPVCTQGITGAGQ